jgi:S1-C subfamily serine protease
LKVNGVTRGSAGDKAGLRTGDQIIAVDGKVFPSVGAFASYVGSMPPAGRISIDYMPGGGGPQQAQRVGVTLGGGSSTAASPGQPASSGLSTGEKVAIGVGAVALFGCYKLGCFSHLRRPGAATQPQPAQ